MPNQRSLAWTAVILFGLAAAGGSAERPAGQPPEPVYLADEAADLVISVTQGWGELGWNTAVKPLDRPASPMRIKDRQYERGLGHHAPGEILVDLAGQYQTFEVDVGIHWQGGQNLASVVFQIFVDDEKRFDSGVVREPDPPRHVSVSVKGAEELRLVATDAGDGITCDCANWADARLIPDPSPAVRPASEAFMDVAAFARVVTSDPKRLEGTRASRTEEFPADDVLLSTEVLPGAGGTYSVPVAGGVGCIGLQWAENRELRYAGLEFAPGDGLPDVAGVEVQYWTGESPWQGAWKRLDAAPQQDGQSVLWRMHYREITRGTPKIRWLFPSATAPIVIGRFQAITRSRCKTVGLHLECEPPHAGKPCRIELYNGTIVGPASGSTPLACPWDTSGPLRLEVRYSVPRSYKADRTVLRLSFPEAAFGVAVEDLLANDCVYVPQAGLFAVREPAPVTLEEYRRQIAERKTVLDDVRGRPDQTFTQAMAAVHNPVQDLGPTMLCLACDNRKFVVGREGALHFDLYEQPDDPPRNVPKQCRLVPQFGSGQPEAYVRHLEGGWLPIPVTSLDEHGIRYRQRSYVAPLDADPPADAPLWLRDRAVCVAEYEIENTTDQKEDATLALALTTEEQPANWQCSSGRALVVQGDRLVVLADASGATPLELTTEGGTLRLAGAMPPEGRARVIVWIPAWKVGPAQFPASADAADLRAQTERYWKRLLEPAMQAELPDPLLANVLRASQVHCLLAARNESRGARIAPWISADRYGPLESEANSIIRGMGLWGHADFSARSLDFLLKRYSEAGYLTTGYTVVGTGWNLWTLAEHFDLVQDRGWLQGAAPTVARACRWIVRQRAKTKRLDPRGEKLPGYGLMPPGVSADWNRYAYRFFNDAHYCAGLTAAARALRAIGHPDGDDLLRDAQAYREEILRAFRFTQARSPVVKLQNGTWIPNHPGIVGFFGNLEEFTPGEDWNRTWAGSVEIGSHYLAALGILDPLSPDAASMIDYLEDHQFLRAGMGDYPEQASREDPFNLGGFAKVQPYYCRIPEIYALRDEVKPFVRAYFNAIPSLLSRENLSLWEHFHNGGGWNKTHETGRFLAQSRMMLVHERGDELWLAPCVTSSWLEDGMRVGVRNAPTRFGEVSYEIRSSAQSGVIEATVAPPGRTPPKCIVLRLRHPDGKKMQKVFVDGRPHDRFDSEHETVTLAPAGTKVTVRAEYE